MNEQLRAEMSAAGCSEGSSCSSEEYMVDIYVWEVDGESGYHATRSDDGGDTWSERTGPGGAVWTGVETSGGSTSAIPNRTRISYCCPNCPSSEP